MMFSFNTLLPICSILVTVERACDLYNLFIEFSTRTSHGDFLSHPIHLESVPKIVTPQNFFSAEYFKGVTRSFATPDIAKAFVDFVFHNPAFGCLEDTCLGEVIYHNIVRGPVVGPLKHTEPAGQIAD